MDNNKINEAALTKRLKTLVLQERYEDALKELEELPCPPEVHQKIMDIIQKLR